MNPEKYIYYRDLIRVLVSKELKLRYKNTILGYAWSVLHPLAFALVYFFVFKIVMRIQMENYALFIITGLFPWQWFNNSVNASNFFFLGNSSLIKKVKFPRSFLVLTGVLNDLIHFVATIPVIVIFMLMYRKYPSGQWFYQLPLLVLVQFGFTYGVSLFVATCNLFFRDLERITNIFTMLWFFLTPIIFPIEMIPERYRWFLIFNPMASLIASWRKVFLEGTLPWDLLTAASCFTVLAFIFGSRVYKKLEWRFAEIV